VSTGKAKRERYLEKVLSEQMESEKVQSAFTTLESRNGRKSLFRTLLSKRDCTNGGAPDSFDSAVPTTEARPQENETASHFAIHQYR
jgi:hypothetical protein